LRRRNFIAGLAGALGSAWLSTACGVRGTAAPPGAPAANGAPKRRRQAPPQPPYRTAIELEGRLAGWAGALGGARLPARRFAVPVPGHPPPAPNFPRIFQPLVIAAGADMSPAFYAWMGSFFLAGPRPARTGAVVSTDSAGRPVARRVWRGRVASVRLPALSRADCSAASLAVEIAVESAWPENPGPRLDPRHFPPHSFRRCDFRLQIEGPESAGRSVLRIAPIVFRRSERAQPGGAVQAETPRISPLVITLPANRAGIFAAWFASGGDRAAQLALPGPRGRGLQFRFWGVRPQAEPRIAGAYATVQLAVAAATLRPAPRR
jgi:hypothetical protein